MPSNWLSKAYTKVLVRKGNPRNRAPPPFPRPMHTATMIERHSTR